MSAQLKSGGTASDELVRHAVSGDQEARSKLVAICLPRVWRTVYLTCGRAQDAEDLVQSAMIQALEKIHFYRGPDRFFAWLDTLTINVVNMHFRKRIPWPIGDLYDEAEALVTQPRCAPDRRYEVGKLWSGLLEQIARIKPKNRVAMVLSTFYGYSAKEIAEIIDCTPQAAQKRSRRGFLELATRLKADPNFTLALQELVP